MSVIAYPEMIKRGYPKWMAAGVIASAGGIALLIPPSITLILFGVITEISIVDLFFAGVVPGIMLAISDAVIIVAVSVFVVKLPAGTFELGRCWHAFKAALPALLMPVLVLGGLYGGLDCSRRPRPVRRRPATRLATVCFSRAGRFGRS